MRREPLKSIVSCVWGVVMTSECGESSLIDSRGSTARQSAAFFAIIVDNTSRGTGVPPVLHRRDAGATNLK